MKTFKIIAGLVVFALFVSTGWQIAGCELANAELKDDLKDVASLNSSKIGMASEQSDDDLREAVIRKAADHDIELDPDEIVVERSGTKDNPVVFLAAKYQMRVRLPGVSFVFHFTATSG